jgi:hypothetical protein
VSRARWAAGVHVERGLTPNLSTELEYLCVGAGAVNIPYDNMVRFGVNYRFGG